MKSFLLFVIVSFSSCVNNAQDQPCGEITVNENFRNFYFDDESVLVGNDGVTVILNADLRDKNRIKFPLDSCFAQIVNDSLSLSFKAFSNVFTNELKISIHKNFIFGRYHDRELPVEKLDTAKVCTLILTSSNFKSGNTIFGQIDVQIPNKNGKGEINYYGPFKFTIQ